jgi:hypothetical protein
LGLSDDLNALIGGAPNVNRQGGLSQVQPALAFNPLLADAQEAMRPFSSTNQIGGAYAASRVLDSQEHAKRELDRLKQLQEAGISVPQAHLDELEGIVNPSFGSRMLQAAAPVFKALELFDRPRQLVTLAFNDLMQWDQKDGQEIGLQNYAQLLRGDKESLIKELGADIVGEDGMIGFSTVLDDLGWEKTDNAFNNFVRGVATFGGEVVTDPLSYLTVGALGIAKAQRGRFLASTIDDHAGLLRTALKEGNQEAMESIGDLGKTMWRAGDGKAADIQQETLDAIEEAIVGHKDPTGVLAKFSIDADDIADLDDIEFLNTLMNDDAFLGAVRNDAIDRAVVETADETFNRAAPALMAKDWNDPVLREVADAMGSSPMLKGGIRLQIPFYTQKTGKATGALPGSRGLGRKISNKLFGHSSEYASATRAPGATGAKRLIEETLAPNLYRRWTEAADKFSDAGFWRSVQRGDVPNAKGALRMQQNMSQYVGYLADNSGSRALARSAIDFGRLATDHEIADGDLQLLIRGMGRIMETRPNATVDEIAEDLRRYVSESGGSLSSVPREVVDAAQKWSVQTRAYMDFMHKEAKEIGLVEGDGLQNYVPHMLTGEANDLLDDLIARSIGPKSVDDIGDQILSALIEARRRSQTIDEQVVGEAAGASQRTIGRTVTRSTGDTSMPFVIGDTVLHDKNLFGADTLSASEINQRLRDSIDRLVEDHPGFSPPKPARGKDLPFTVYNENTFSTVQAYGHDMMMAVAERRLLLDLESVGLIDDTVTYVNQQTLANSLAEKLGKYGTDVIAEAEALTGRMLDEKMTMIRSIRDGADEGLDLVDIEVAGKTVQIPKASIEANKRLQSRIAKIATQQGRASEVQARANAFYADTFSALRKQGVDDATAQGLAEAATRKEVSGILKDARKEIKGRARREVQHLSLAQATAHKTVLEAREAAFREITDRVTRAKSALSEANATVDAGIRDLRRQTEEIVRENPIASGGGMQAVSDGIRVRMVEDVRGIAENLRTTGDVEPARMIDTIADFLESAQGRGAELESLGVQIREVIENVTMQHRQHIDQLDGLNPQLIAEADQYMDQAIFYEGNILDPGDWGDQMADARFIFHGTTSPNMAQIALSREWGGGGLTANPVRAAVYGGDAWVIVWDLNDMPPGVAGSVRAGQDVESRNQFNLLRGIDSTEGMPKPVAILPAAAVREAAARRAQDPELLSKLARNIASEQVFETWDQPLTNVLRGRQHEEFYAIVDRAMDDPLFVGSQEFVDQIDELFQASAIGRDERILLVPDFAEAFKEELIRHREWSRKGGVDPVTGKPFDIRWDERRKGVLSTWHDTWQPKARKGAPVRTVDEPISAPWVDATLGMGGNQNYEDVFRQLKGTGTPDLNAFDEATGGLDFDKFASDVEQFWQRHMHLHRSGHQTGEMQDIYDATQRSLVARGLEEEFPVWVVDNEHGMARLSLVPVDGAATYRVRREDVLMDWGAMFPQDLSLLDDAARARRHHVLVDPSRIRVDKEVDLGAATGLPPKAALHNMRPENMNLQKMQAMFGDAAVAEEAYADLLNRLNLIGPPRLELVEQIAEMRSAANPWFATGSQATASQRAGLLTLMPRVFDQPELYGDLFANPDIQRWFSQAAQEVYGHEYTFARQTLVSDDGGRTFRVGVDGEAGGVDAVVPVRVNREVQRRDALSRTALTRKLRAKGVSATEARIQAKRYAQAQSMSPQARRALPEELQQQLSDAEKFFDGTQSLYNTLLGVGDEVTQALDRAHSLADEAAALQGRAPNMDRLLGRQGGELPHATAATNARRAVEDLRGQWAIDPDAPLGATVSLRSGNSPTRGVSVGSGLGEVRFAAPDGITEELFDAVEREIDDWVSVLGRDALSRPGSHVGVWFDREAGELVMEISGVTGTVAQARRLGMDLDQSAVFDLSTGREISLPSTAARLKGEIREAQKGVAASSILDDIDKQMKGNRFDKAEGILLDSKNESVLRAQLGNTEFDNMLDLVRTERVLALNMVPEKEALRAARQSRRLLGDNEKALEAARTIRSEGLEMKAAALSDEVGQVMETQARIGELFQKILGVGLDSERALGDDSLYPRVEGRVTLEASEQSLARVEEARKLAGELGWAKPEAALAELMLNPPKAILAQAGSGPAQHVFSVFGIGGTQTTYKTSTKSIAHMIEQSVSRYQALTTPPGLDMFAKQTRAIARAWKTMATVSRVNFHPRNLIGGVFNGMAADVGFADYAWTRAKGIEYQRLVSRGASIEEMAEHFGEDWAVINGARRTGILGEAPSRTSSAWLRSSVGWVNSVRRVHATWSTWCTSTTRSFQAWTCSSRSSFRFGCGRRTTSRCRCDS